MCDSSSHAHPLYQLQLDPRPREYLQCVYVCACLDVYVGVYVGACGYVIHGSWN